MTTPQAPTATPLASANGWTDEEWRIAVIHNRLVATMDAGWTKIAVATALEYAQIVRNETLEEAAGKVKALTKGLDCENCDSCTANHNAVVTILEMRHPSNHRYDETLWRLRISTYAHRKSSRKIE